MVFFITLVVKGASFFYNTTKTKEWNESRGIFLMRCIMFMAIITGAIRYKTHMPFPTAFFIAGCGVFRDILQGIFTKQHFVW